MTACGVSGPASRRSCRRHRASRSRSLTSRSLRGASVRSSDTKIAALSPTVFGNTSCRISQLGIIVLLSAAPPLAGGAGQRPSRPLMAAEAQQPRQILFSLLFSRRSASSEAALV